MQNLALLLLSSFACSDGPKAETGDSGLDTGDTGDTGGGDTAVNADLTCTSAACGGNPVGDWTITEACYSAEWFSVEDCAGWEARLTNVQVTGGMSVSDDGRYTAELATIDWSGELVIPAACLDTATCAEKGDDTTTCLDDGSGGCLCTGSNSFAGLTAEGDWSADGVALTLDADVGDPATSDYCADADELWLNLEENFFLPIQLLYVRN